jgi:hypothetical protein
MAPVPVACRSARGVCVQCQVTACRRTTVLLRWLTCACAARQALGSSTVPFHGSPHEPGLLAGGPAPGQQIRRVTSIETERRCSAVQRAATAATTTTAPRRPAPTPTDQYYSYRVADSQQASCRLQRRTKRTARERIEISSLFSFFSFF